MSLRRILPLLALVSIVTAAPASADRLRRQSHSPRPIAASPTVPAIACGPLTITQSSSLTPTDFNGVTCTDSNFFHDANSWYRSFHLPDFGIEGEYFVCQVNLAIEFTSSPGGVGQPMTVNLYTNSGCPFPAGTLTPIGTATVTVADQALASLGVPVTGSAPPGSDLVVEIAIPDGTGAQQEFFLGGNAAAQTGPSYIYDPVCGDLTPVDLASIGFPDTHIIMEVVGTEDIVAPTAISVDTAGDGVLSLGEQVVVAPTWKNKSSQLTLAGTASNLTGPGGLTYTLVDASANYGLMAAGSSHNCDEATGDCYAVQIDGAGFGHRDATMDETPLLVAAPTAPDAGPAMRTRILHVGPSFADVAPANPFYRFIETLLHNNVTGGCATPDSFCPTSTTLRKQMAVFLLKALLGSCYVPPPAVGLFTDVPVSDPFAPWIEDLFHRSITTGCGAGIYCPNALVQRKQMAVFLLKTLLGSGYVPPTATGIFDDVPADGFQPFIEDLYNRGITGGCAGGPPPAPISYCPGNPVTRGQMAVFLTKTFNLLLYRP